MFSRLIQLLGKIYLFTCITPDGEFLKSKSDKSFNFAQNAKKKYVTAFFPDSVITISTLSKCFPYKLFFQPL